MHPCHSSQHRDGVRGIGRLVAKNATSNQVGFSVLNFRTSGDTAKNQRGEQGPRVVAFRREIRVGKIAETRRPEQKEILKAAKRRLRATAETKGIGGAIERRDDAIRTLRGVSLPVFPFLRSRLVCRKPVVDGQSAIFSSFDW